MTKSSDRKGWFSLDKGSYGQRLQGSLILLLTAVLWGMGFIAQKLGMDYMQPFSFSGIRNILAAVALVPIVILLNKSDRKKGIPKKDTRSTFIGGLCCGLALFVAANIQQIGIQYTTAGKAGFITAMYIVFVPFIGFFLGKRVRLLFVFSLIIAVIGLYFLCIKEGFSVGKGDVIILACAVVFAVHILVIDHFVQSANPVAMSCIQFVVVGILSLVVAFFIENITAESVRLALPALVYGGVVSSGMGYTLQIVGQVKVPSSIASLIMSLESVFAVIFGAIFLHDVMSPKELLGCVLVFTAVILSQLPEKTKDTK